MKVSSVFEVAAPAGAELRTEALAFAPRAAAPERLGPFEVIDTVHEGANLVVLRALRAQGPRAGEVVRLLVERRSVRDARWLASLARVAVPGVARLLGWGDLHGERCYYETEWPVGPTLEDLRREIGPFETDEALSIASALLDSLARAHAHGHVHGALDGRRVVLAAGQRPVILDLALAARARDAEDPVALRATPPEAWRGKRVDARSDLYSVGVLLFAALTGRYPFDADDPLAICEGHLRGIAPRLSCVGARFDDDVEELVARLLAKEPASRYPSAEVAREAVERARLRRAARPAAPARSGDPPPSGYRFVQRLGEGGAGAVYEAYHEILEKLVAVKVLHPQHEVGEDEARERFFREARLAASLDHPNVVRVQDAREERGRLYLIMELVRGETLKARLAREGSLPEGEVVAIARAVLEALDAAQARGIVHRDLKPENLLLADDGRVKVADFGLARSLASSPEITQAGYLVGTPYYMSPEQCRGEPVDGRSDLYSLGVTLYHALAGAPPFDGGHVITILEKHLREAHVPLERLDTCPRVSSALSRWIDRLLAKSPDDRFSTPRSARLALDVATRSISGRCRRVGA